MKYLALLSGGKDSCFNLLHCEKNGHELVAAASLGPEGGKEELDSYLYQTVGQDAIQFVASALEVPLYRRVITGNAVEQGSEYGSRKPKTTGGVEGDETEDLFALLSEVKARNFLFYSHKDSFSNVVPPSRYPRDQGELFTEMINAGMEAVLIKVAGIELTVKHLGKTLAEMEPTLLKLNELYGAHICGEGGEYESLALDCPLFKRRVVLTDVETVIHSDNDFATVAFLRIRNAVLEEKAAEQDFELAIPPLLDAEYLRLRDAVASSQEISWTLSCIHTNEMKPFEGTVVANTKKLNPWISVSNIQRELQTPPVELSIEDEVVECFELLQARLQGYGLDVSNCANINIFISSIDLFARINAVYSTFFGSSPPARACVAVDLPAPIRVRLECVAYAEVSANDRQALHVQGLSYWAPANIGPYSQAITAGERIFISGQIGMIPSQLTLPSPRSLALEVALASQHISRISHVLKINSGIGWNGYSQLDLYWLAETADLLRVKAVQCATREGPRIPTLYLVVKALPKDALIEKQVLLHTGRCAILDEDDGEMVMQNQEPLFEQRKYDRSI
ncbi:hypothetical protein H0H81_006784 [Sphagnurus paluster]|uniref:Diphthine--ammonia ligase n=1 Tax=Sphagnurus paluster TaxID=117069 RepID=A0A9P7GJV6_9AGAR|nr:hypothetical protein H0H81_006784 [Sphagnurus paluster]